MARHVARGFYSLEDSLVVDMLVRYPCLREEDLSELLRFDRKMLRARTAGLTRDRVLQARQRIETDPEGKVARMNCYYINYRSLVNVVKYRLDLMRKKMEASERDATARASFRCSGCGKAFSDLEADQLLDTVTMEFRWGDADEGDHGGGGGGGGGGGARGGGGGGGGDRCVNKCAK